MVIAIRQALLVQIFRNVVFEKKIYNVSWLIKHCNSWHFSYQAKACSKQLLRMIASHDRDLDDKLRGQS